MNLYDVVVAKALSGGGGGGSSDFSTAKLTVVNNVPAAFVWGIPGVADFPDYFCAYGSTSVPASNSETFDIILYKGIAELYAPVQSGQISVSGDIEHDSGPYYLVTGDATITISE